MTTLKGNELFEYLGHLKSELDKRTSDSNDFSSLMHNQMYEIINSERKYLEYMKNNNIEPMLSISPNGLPSVESLKSDLGAMCELDKKNGFEDITKKYRKNFDKKNKSEIFSSYVPVPEDEWNEELKNRKKERLLSKIGFKINRTEDDKFELFLRENLYLKGYDEHSKKFPVLIREGRMRYHVVWNQLIDDIEDGFYVPNTALILQGRPTKLPKKLFDDVTRFYGFNKKDYKSYKGRMPFLFWGSWTPNNYSEFLSAGSNVRVNITNNILETLSEALGRKVNIKGISKNDLEVALTFSTIPFENALQTTLEEEDLFEVDKEGNIIKNKHLTKFNLIYTRGAEEVGIIEYFLPRNAVHFSRGAYGGRYRVDP